MNTPTPEHDELARLISALLEGTITPDGHASLTERLRDDPAARAAYHDAIELHGLLRWEHTTSAVAPEQPAAPEPEAPAYRFPAAGPRALIAATLLIGAAAVAIYFAINAGSSSTGFAARPIATLIDTTGTVIANDQLAHPGAEYPAGTYVIESGVAEFLLTNQVGVTLEGGTRLMLHSDMRSTLTRGAATFNCPPQAKGYTVVVPGDARVIDLGTRFIVDARPAGPCEVRVLEGHVRIERGEKSVDLTPAHIASIDRATGAISLRPTPKNLVVNGGFEVSVKGDPADADAWDNHVYPTNQARSSAHAHSGSSSLRLFTAPDGGTSSDIRQNVYVTPDAWGKPYKFSMWVLNPRGSESLAGLSFKAYLRPRKADSTILETKITPYVTASSPAGEWVELTLEGDVPAETEWFLIELVAHPLKSDRAQAVYIDDVSFAVDHAVRDAVTVGADAPRSGGIEKEPTTNQKGRTP